MKRRDFLKTGLAVAAHSLVPASAETRTTPPLNLLFITADDLNYSAFGETAAHGLHPAPQLDAFSAGCVRFVNNRTVVAICQPSREAMMTGLWPHRSGGLGFNPVHEGTPTLTSVLKAHGYYTAAMHKIEHMQPPSCFNWDDTVDGQGRNPVQHGETVTAAIAKAKQLGKPFYINCNITDPHRPFYGSKGAAKMDQNETGPFHIQHPYTAEDVTVPGFLEDLPDIRTEFAQYMNSIQRLDLSIGRILAALEESGEAGDTIVYFTSDHGMPFPFAKATVYTNGTRTPSLLRIPGMRPRTMDALTMNIDVMPTLLDLLDVPAPPQLNGRSWKPLLHGIHQQHREFTIGNINTLATGENFPMRSVDTPTGAFVFSPWANGTTKYKSESMTGLTWNAIQAAAASDPRIATRTEQWLHGYLFAYYDLQKDPGQRMNVIHLPQYKPQVELARQRLLHYMESTNDPQLENYKLALAGKTPVVIQPDKPLFEHYNTD